MLSRKESEVEVLNWLKVNEHFFFNLGKDVEKRRPTSRLKVNEHFLHEDALDWWKDGSHLCRRKVISR